jgi:hypothetical protein
VFTGGLSCKETVIIEFQREFAVTHKPDMLTARAFHGSVYHAGHLYVVGGLGSSRGSLKKCERFVSEESRWEAISPLPTACMHMSCAVSEGSLYALGGQSGPTCLDLIHKLSLVSLTWEVLQQCLPCAIKCVPCFKGSEVYFIVQRSVYSLQSLQVLKTLSEDVPSARAYYYSGDSLIVGSEEGPSRQYVIGVI